jgi:hypothetical protein
MRVAVFVVFFFWARADSFFERLMLCGMDRVELT